MTLHEFELPRARMAPVLLRWPEVPGLWAFLALTLVLAGAVIASFALSVETWTPAAAAALALLSASALWLAGGAATALLGLCRAAPAAHPVPEGWRPVGRTAILVTLCGEPPAPLATHLAGLRAALDRNGLAGLTRIFVLSDTRGAERIAAEEPAFAPLAAAGALVYRRRHANPGRKPGNIADWFATHGAAHDYMLVLDADSRMSAGRILRLIHRMETRPATGLLQAGMGLVPARSRFGRHQRVAARLLGAGFGRGLAAWAGETGNYWGHNAILRTAAFASAVDLPTLSGPPPFGGPPLSHDFIEAAWIRRAGWRVELDPDAAGSAEDGPQTLEEFHRRDRRWCQGNLQHLRLLAEPGLHPVSRLHLLFGILGYLVAPLWMALVVLLATGAVPAGGILPFAVVAALLLLPKLCALALWWARARTPARRRVILRAAGSELWLSTLIAPLVMLRQAAAVGAVLIGRDCGWKSDRAARLRLPQGGPELLAGLALVGLAVAGTGAAALWLLPPAVALLGAPVILPALEAGA